MRSNSLPALGVSMLIILALFCTAGIQPGKQEAVAANEGSGIFVWFSDIHFDPFYYNDPHDEGNLKLKAMIEELADNSGSSPQWKDGAEWGAVFAQHAWQGSEYSAAGHDSNQKLLQDVLRQATKVSAPRPNFILITGDLLAHSLGLNYSLYAPSNMQTESLYHDFVSQTVKYIAFSVNAGSLPPRPNLPVPPIFATLGNNDSNCGDYAIHLDFTDSDFLAETASTFLTYFLPNLSASEKAAFEESFKAGGYYSVQLPNALSGRRLFVLNSIPFTKRYPDNGHYGNYPLTKQACNSADANYEIDANAQLKWLKTQAGNSGRAWIAVHVPPGFECFSYTPESESSNWLPQYLSAFKQLFLDTATKDNLAGTLAGHSHMSSFKLLRDDSKNAVSSVIQASSVSPIFSNNPSFGVVRYDRGSLKFESYQIYYRDRAQAGPVWSHYQFAGISGPVGTSSLESLYGRLGNSQDLSDWNTFRFDYGARAGSAVDYGQLSQSNLGCLGSLQ